MQGEDDEAGRIGAISNAFSGFGNWIRRLLGMAPKPYVGPPSSSAAQQMIASARPVGSVLRSTDLYHTAGASQVERITDTATVFNLTGGDGVKRVLVQMPGAIGDVAGRFEWIVDYEGNLSHQFFVPGGTINGIPIQQ